MLLQNGTEPSPTHNQTPMDKIRTLVKTLIFLGIVPNIGLNTDVPTATA
jgi:hypothetical protein